MPTSTDLWGQKIQAHQKDVHAIIARDFSASRMNTTKWREVSENLYDLPILLSLSVKFVHENEVYLLQGFWHVTGDWFDSGSPGPFTGIEVEWLDINPLEHERRGSQMMPTEKNYAKEVEQCLQAASIPYFWENDCIRIVGHVRNQQV